MEASPSQRLVTRNRSPHCQGTQSQQTCTAVQEAVLLWAVQPPRLSPQYARCSGLLSSLTMHCKQSSSRKFSISGKCLPMPMKKGASRWPSCAMRYLRSRSSSRSSQGNTSKLKSSSGTRETSWARLRHKWHRLCERGMRQEAVGLSCRSSALRWSACAIIRLGVQQQHKPLRLFQTLLWQLHWRVHCRRRAGKSSALEPRPRWRSCCSSAHAHRRLWAATRHWLSRLGLLAVQRLGCVACELRS
mmetsp:Transcript_16845/g.39524  ORF Transcript_16845/g.39524 Transcript_16845/m.39524 type:complete len:245 (+) Transcript_16845:526-1260(+)